LIATTIAYPSVVEECCTVCSSGSRTNGTAYCAPHCYSHATVHIGVYTCRSVACIKARSEYSQGLKGYSQATRGVLAPAAHWHFSFGARLGSLVCLRRIAFLLHLVRTTVPAHRMVQVANDIASFNSLLCVHQRRCCTTRADCSTRRIPRSDRESCGFRTLCRLRHPSAL
jgi:hypothetical protein